MSTNFPGSQDDNTTLPNPTASSTTNSPSLSGGQTNQNDAIKAIEAKVGTGASTPTNNNFLVGTGTGTSAWNKTVPTGAVVGTTDSQTLTNKILTSPTINTATISNPTLTVDTISGFSTSTIGTAYGLGINNGTITGVGATMSGNGSFGGTLTSTGLLTASNGFTLSSGTLTLPNNSVTAPMLATSAITLGYAQITTNVTGTSASDTYATGLGVSVTIPAGGRRVKVIVYASRLFSSTGNSPIMGLYSGATVGTLTNALQQCYGINSATLSAGACLVYSAVVSAGTIAFSATLNSGGASTATIQASSSAPAFILVELI